MRISFSTLLHPYTTFFLEGPEGVGKSLSAFSFLHGEVTIGQVTFFFKINFIERIYV